MNTLMLRNTKESFMALMQLLTAKTISRLCQYQFLSHRRLPAQAAEFTPLGSSSELAKSPQTTKQSPAQRITQPIIPKPANPSPWFPNSSKLATDTKPTQSTRPTDISGANTTPKESPKQTEFQLSPLQTQLQTPPQLGLSPNRQQARRQSNQLQPRASTEVELLQFHFGNSCVNVVNESEIQVRFCTTTTNPAGIYQARFAFDISVEHSCFDPPFYTASFVSFKITRN